jgi:hypothetical protein
MTVAKEKEDRNDLGEAAEMGIHLPAPSPTMQNHHNHDHGLEVGDMLRVSFVALAAIP